VIGILRVTDLQSGRDPLASEHARHNGGIVQTDTGAGIQNGIYVGSIAGGGIGSLIVVIGNISGDIIIDPGDHLQIGGCAFRQFLPLGNDFAVCRKIHVLIRIEKRTEFIRDLYVQIRIQAGGIVRTGNIFVDRHIIISVARGERKRLVAASVQIIGIDNGVGTGDAQFDFGTGAGIIGTDIAIGHMRIIDDSYIIGHHRGAVGLWYEADGSGIPQRSRRGSVFRVRGSSLRGRGVGIRRSGICGGLVVVSARHRSIHRQRVRSGTAGAQTHGHTICN